MNERIFHIDLKKLINHNCKYHSKYFQSRHLIIEILYQDL